MWYDPAFAKAWLVPCVGFNVNWRMPAGTAEPCEWPATWRSYPRMPFPLPMGGLYLRFVIMSREPDNPYSRHLRLLLLRRGEGQVSECQAWRVTTALTGMLSLDHMMMDPRQSAPVPIPEHLMPAYELEEDALLDALGHGDNGPSLMHPYRSAVQSYAMTGHDWGELIKYLPAFVLDRDLWQAAQYYLASASLFAFVGDDVRWTLHERGELPDTVYRMVDAETAVWLAFKAVEAIIGDPSGSPKKLVQEIETRGLGDFPGVWKDEEPAEVVERILGLEEKRDKQAAHGKQHLRRRPLTYFDVMDAQYLARGLIIHYAEQVLQRECLPVPSDGL